MTLRLYNTLSRNKEEFAPLDPKNVRMYVCGPTVYDFAHIGNARPVIVFDVLFRLLRHFYGDAHVTYVRNITDVEDKINARAAEEGISIRALTKRTAKQFHEDVKALRCLTPTHEPRATDHIAAMIAMNERLIASGHAYVAEGHVLYDVSSKPDYGKLARRSLDEMLAGARVEVAPYKKNPMDFVLWKPSTPDQPGWDSPWGRGRPGWHIECSAMSEALLGETFDIHGGGIDLVFPHHENEIAQSEGAHHGHPLAKIWMHNGFLQVEGEKMSKSLGNFFTLRELLESNRFGGQKWDGEVLRFAMLQTHYRQPIDWTPSLLRQSKARLENWKTFAAERRQNKKDFPFEREALSALEDDLNTPAAFAIIDQVVHKELPSDKDRYTVYTLLKRLGFSGPESSVLKIADSLSASLLKMRNLSLHDWDLIASNVRENPLLRSGNPKSATTLVAAMLAMKDIVTLIAPHLENADSSSEVRILVKSLLDDARPKPDTLSEMVSAAIAARNAARKAKNFKESDRIRDELLAKGIVLKDGPDGTTWEVKR